MIETNGERESVKSVLAVRHDDDDIFVAKGDLGTRAYSPLCRLITKAERAAKSLTQCPRKLLASPI